MDMMNFDELKPQEYPFSYQGKNYILREPTEGAASEWENLNAKAARMIDGKVIGVDGIADSSAVLVARCTVELVPNRKGEGTLERDVSPPVVRGWPRRMTKVLYDKAKEMGGLNEINDPTILRKRIEADTKRLREMTERNGSSSLATSGGQGSDAEQSVESSGRSSGVDEGSAGPFDHPSRVQPSATSTTSA